MPNGGVLGPKNGPETNSNFGLWETEEVQQAISNSTWKASPVQDGLVLHLDATNPASYTAGSTTWYDLSPTKLNFTGTASFMSTTNGLSSGTGSTWSSAVTSLLNNDSHSIFFNIRFNTNTTYPQSTSGNWEKVFTYAPAGTDRAPGIWRFPDARWLHWRYDPTNTGPNIGGSGAANNEATNPSEDFVGDTWYYVGVTKSGSTGAIYINGQPAGTWTLPATKTAGTASIILFEGYTLASANIDNVQVYSRPITAAEVLTNYKASQARLVNIPAAFLVVGGGGGGGMDMGGGGGAGGFVSGNRTLVRGSSYALTVGAGGAGAPAAGTSGQPTGHQYTISAKNGSDSVFFDPVGGNVYAKGGGYGASSYWGYTPNNGYGGAGGSGGGASGYSDGNTGRQGVANQNSTYGYGLGNNGGNNTNGQYWSAGGGGAGGVGSNSNSSTAATGGIGVRNQILGTDYFWAGGGGGAGYSREGGPGGNGGGGAGGTGTLTGGYGLNNGGNTSGGSPNSWANVPGGNGGANTGGGGGGGSHYNSNNKGGDGGSGVVILRYADYYPDLDNIKGLTWTKVTVPGYKIYKFTGGSGSFTVPATAKYTTDVVKTSLQMYLDAASPASYQAGNTTWNDLSGNGNHCTFSGTATYSSSRGGNVVFNGVDTYANVPGTLSLHPGITVSGVINFGSPQVYERFVDLGSSNPQDNVIVYREGTSNNLSFWVGNGTSNIMYMSIPDAIPNNTWAFYSCSYDGTTATICINGRFYTQSTTGTIPNVTRTKSYIGKSNWPGEGLWDSGMQVVMTYNRALTQAETIQNYLAFKPRLDALAYATDPNAQYLKLAIPFSDEQGIRDQSAAIKGSGTSFATYAVNGATVNRDITGKFYGPSLALTPYTRKAHVAVQNNPNLWLTNQDFTIEGWWYFAANNVGYQNLASHSGDTGDQQSGWVLYLEGNNTLNFIGSQGWALAVNSSTIPTTGTWHHVAASRSNNTTRLFLNGTQIGISTQVVNIVSPTSQTLRIGDYQWFPGGERGFSGYVQDFRMYIGVGKYTGTFTPPTQMRL